VCSNFSYNKASKISKKRFVKCLRSTGVIPYAAYEKSRLKLGCIKGALEREREREKDGSCADRAHVRSRW